VITEFARTVQDVENLNMLYLLTYADLSAVSRMPGRVEGCAAASISIFGPSEIRAVRAVNRKAPATAVRFHGLQDAARGSFEPDEIRSLIEAHAAPLSEHNVRSKAAVTTSECSGISEGEPRDRHRHRPDKGYTELTVCAYDAYGMFYRTAGTIAAKNLNVLRAQVYTGRNGVMIDTFQITDAEGKLITYDEVWKSITADPPRSAFRPTQAA